MTPDPAITYGPLMCGQGGSTDGSLFNNCIRKCLSVSFDVEMCRCENVSCKNIVCSDIHKVLKCKLTL